MPVDGSILVVRTLAHVHKVRHVLYRLELDGASFLGNGGLYDPTGQVQRASMLFGPEQGEVTFFHSVSDTEHVRGFVVHTIRKHVLWHDARFGGESNLNGDLNFTIRIAIRSVQVDPFSRYWWVDVCWVA